MFLIFEKSSQQSAVSSQQSAVSIQPKAKPLTTKDTEEHKGEPFNPHAKLS